MSYYPNYPAPGYGYPVAPVGDPRSSARRAAILMWLIGGLALVCGGALFGISQVPTEKFPAEMQQAVQEMEQQFGVSWQSAMKWEGVVTGGVGVLGVLLAFGVWQSRRVPIIVALVVACLAFVRQAIGLAAVLASSGGGGQVVGAACVSGPILVVIGLLVVWLVQAFRNAPRARALLQQPPMSGYGYAMPGQGYPTGGYGYPPPGGYAPTGGYPPRSGYSPPGSVPPPPPPTQQRQW